MALSSDIFRKAALRSACEPTAASERLNLLHVWLECCGKRTVRFWVRNWPKQTFKGASGHDGFAPSCGQIKR